MRGRLAKLWFPCDAREAGEVMVSLLCEGGWRSYGFLVMRGRLAKLWFPCDAREAGEVMVSL